MAPPCGDAASAAAAADLTSVLSREGARLPPLPGRVGGNAAERGEDGDKNKKAKKENTQRITGWGLREYSKIVSKKVETKGRTTYNEVADEIFAELTMALNGQEFDERNIRRRVYDSFNVLIALRIIAKDKKEIKWMGLSNFRSEKIKKLEEARKELMTKIKNKKKLLQEIEKQFDDLHYIKLRNQVLQRPAESANGIHLPFLLVKASRKARVEIEISEDSKFACFDFSCTPFTLHDDVSILDGIRRNSIRRAGFATLH
ncbi:transcription factor-like protein DPB isoform X2 [Phragmites australis]|uniref:transcription factor-like protein DPB isoform X2 n=1 Tax=Phragmites australis TaxID=29695 RepID=UPI002D77E4B2|nr:transcription factor-like protein DPB isoform X2 [Phragmites australis]